MNFDFFDRTTLEWIIPGIFYAAVLIEIFYQVFFYIRLLFLKKSSEDILEKPLSVCFCVRNEEEKIDEVMSQLLGQNYSNFEVVVVDDYSEDSTLIRIGQWAQKDSRVKFTSMSQETRFSEKLAINLALKAAGSEQVIFVHADALDFDPQYLKKINNGADNVGLTLNYSNYKAERSFYNKFCRVERFFLFLKSAAYSKIGLPLFFEENNVLFPKDVYFKSEGFRGKMRHHFANLELVFNEKVKGKTNISVDPETFVREDISLGKGHFAELMNKQIRIKQNLKLGKRLILTVENYARIVFLVALTWLLVAEPKGWLFILLPALIVLTMQFFIIKSMSARLNETKIFLSSFVYVFVRPVLQIYFASKIYMIDKRNKWN